MRRKYKVLLSTLTPVVGVTAIVTPLAIVLSQQHESKVSALEQWADKQFNISEKTYKKLIRDYTDQFNLWLKDPANNKNGDREWEEREINKFNSAIRRFESIKANGANGFATITSVIIQHAHSHYGFNLARETNITNTDIQTSWQSCKESFIAYMNANGITSQAEQQTVLNDADRQFNNPQVQDSINAIADPLNKLQKAQEVMITCFDSINDEIALFSAAKKISEFEGRYSVELKKNSEGKTAVRYDTLKGIFEEEGIEIGKALTVEQMNTYFTFHDLEQDKDVTFSPTELLPGYELKPYFAGWGDNPLSNDYSAKVDWTAKSLNHRIQTSNNDEDIVAHKYTATVFKGKTDVADSYTLGENEELPTLSEAIKASTIKIDSHKLYGTNDFEVNALKNTYFNKNKNDNQEIEFKFNDDLDACAWEAIFSGEKITGTSIPKYKLNWSQLGDLGVQIRCGNNAEWSNINTVLKCCNDKIKGHLKNSDIEFSLLENFLMNCQIEGIVTVDSDGDVKKADVEIYAYYTNTTDSESNRYKFKQTLITPDGIHVSKDFFIKSCTVYKDASDYFNVYSQNDFDKIMDKTEYVEHTLVISLVVCSLFITFAFFKECADRPHIKPHPEPYEDIMRDRIGMAVAAAGIAITALGLHVWHKYTNHIDKCAQLADEFSKNEIVQKITSILDKDKDLYDVPWITNDRDEDIIDLNNKKFKEKFEKFNALSVDGENGTLAKLAYYKNVRYSDDAKQFTNLLCSEKYKMISPENFKSFSEPWIDDGDEIVKVYVYLFYGIVCAVVCVIFFCLDIGYHQYYEKQKIKWQQDYLDLRHGHGREAAQKFVHNMIEKHLERDPITGKYDDKLVEDFLSGGNSPLEKMLDRVMNSFNIDMEKLDVDSGTLTLEGTLLKSPMWRHVKDWWNENVLNSNFSNAVDFVEYLLDLF